jgi:hypothetical protein
MTADVTEFAIDTPQGFVAAIGFDPVAGPTIKACTFDPERALGYALDYDADVVLQIMNIDGYVVKLEREGGLVRVVDHETSYSTNWIGRRRYAA